MGILSGRVCVLVFTLDRFLKPGKLHSKDLRFVLYFVFNLCRSASFSKYIFELHAQFVPTGEIHPLAMALRKKKHMVDLMCNPGDLSIPAILFSA